MYPKKSAITNAKWHFITARICIFLCCFMYADSYIVPLYTSNVALTEKNTYRYRTRKSHGITYQFKTSGPAFDATAALYNSTSVDDTLVLYRSLITGTIQKAGVPRADGDLIFETGFIRAHNGRVFVPVVLLGLVLYHIFYYSIIYTYGRRNLLLAMLAATIILFLFYLDINLF
jgi:hypothetical protein